LKFFPYFVISFWFFIFFKIYHILKRIFKFEQIWNLNKCWIKTNLKSEQNLKFMNKIWESWTIFSKSWTTFKNHEPISKNHGQLLKILNSFQKIMNQKSNSWTIFKKKSYFLCFIKHVVNRNVSRDILVLDTFILVTCFMERREYTITWILSWHEEKIIKIGKKPKKE
jgi:hypothetical protein